MLLQNGKTIGLEVTHTAVSNHFANLKRASQVPGSVVEIGSTGASYYRAPGEPLSCEPFYGNEAEVLWTKLVMKSISGKLAKLNKKHFASMDRNVLLIRNFTNIPVRSPQLTIASIQESVSRCLPRQFGEVSIIWGDHTILFDVMRTNEEIRLPWNQEDGGHDKRA